jgi:hypothetical protein
MQYDAFASLAPGDATLTAGRMREHPALMPDAIEFGRLARSEERMDPALFPKRFDVKLGEYREHHYGRWPDFFPFVGLWVVSDRVANVLTSFVTGGGEFVPVEMNDLDTCKLMTGRWFLWQLCARKLALEPDSSRNIFPVGEGRHIHAGISDGDLVLKSDALSGADIWTDPQLQGVIFLSADLSETLRSAGLATHEAGIGELKGCTLEKSA